MENLGAGEQSSEWGAHLLFNYLYRIRDLQRASRQIFACCQLKIWLYLLDQWSLFWQHSVRVGNDVSLVSYQLVGFLSFLASVDFFLLSTEHELDHCFSEGSIAYVRTKGIDVSGILLGRERGICQEMNDKIPYRSHAVPTAMKNTQQWKLIRNLPQS